MTLLQLQWHRAVGTVLPRWHLTPGTTVCTLILELYKQGTL